MIPQSTRIPPDILEAWEIAAYQLELQFDARHWDGFLSKLSLYDCDVERGLIVLCTTSPYVAAYTMHRLTRDIRAVLAMVFSCRVDDVRVEIRCVAARTLPLVNMPEPVKAHQYAREDGP